MIKVEWFYWLCGILFLIIAVVRMRDRDDRKRFGSAAFWAILAFCFGYGTFVVDKTAPALVEGVAVLSSEARRGGKEGRSRWSPDH